MIALVIGVMLAFMCINYFSRPSNSNTNDSAQSSPIEQRLQLLHEYQLVKAIQQGSPQKYKELKNIIIKSIGIIFVLGAGVFVVARFLEIPVLEFVYGVELKSYLLSAMIIILGSVFYGASIIISFILIAMRKTLSQVITYGLSAICATIIAYKLTALQEIQGAAITYIITMISIVIIFAILLRNELINYKRKWKEDSNR